MVHFKVEKNDIYLYIYTFILLAKYELKMGRFKLDSKI